MPSQQSRARGALVATLCGDALGAPYEWKKSNEIRADLVKRGGLIAHEYEPFDYIDPWKKKREIKAGQPTDDSELAAALAASLAEHPHLNEEDLFKRLRRFIIDRKSMLTNDAYGSGGTLRSALTPPTYDESVAAFAAGTVRRPPSNGSLMRSIAVPFAAEDEFWTKEIAARQSRVTHRNPIAVASCVAFSLLVRGILTGRSPAEAWREVCALEHDDSLMWVAWAIGPEPEAPTEAEIWRKDPFGPGDAIVSLKAAVWASVTAESFADGIIKVISLGGDTDTYGAIAGGILGAHFGLEGIPERWLSILQGRDVMLDLADRLCARRTQAAA